MSIRKVIKPISSPRQVIETILTRYDKYQRFLNFPGDWGERAFRGWLVYDLFHSELGWPIPNIVFGEVFDVLFVNDRVMPVVYLETKKPRRGLADKEAFIERIHGFQTIVYAILTDGYDWLRYQTIDQAEIHIRFTDDDKEWTQFLQPLHAKIHLYEVSP